MFAGTVIFATITYVVMLLAFFNARFQSVHRPVMASIMLIDLFLREAQFKGNSLGEFAVRLMEHGIFEILGLHTDLFHHGNGRAFGMRKISRLACKTSGMLRIKLMFAPPEIGRVGHV